MEKKKFIALVAPLALVNLATIALAVATSTRTLSAFDHMEPNTNIVIDDGTTPEEPDVPVTPDDPTTPDEPEEPGDPETPEIPEEPGDPEEPEIPTISLDVIYDFNEIKALLMSYPDELNGSYCTMKVRVAGNALGTPGYCFFQDVNDIPVTSSSQINNNFSNFLAREDVGNNNVGFTRGDIIILSGNVTWGKSTYLGTQLVVIK